MPQYYVSCQHYYYSREYVVEIAIGGVDYSGADMLNMGYERLGEGRTFTDPREAALAAQNIAIAWALNSQDNPHMTVVNTMGMGLEGEPMAWEEVQQWAEQTYEKAPKCDWCGKLIPGEPWRFQDILEDEQFCSEFHANVAVAEEELYQYQCWVESSWQEFQKDCHFNEDGELIEEWSIYFDEEITWNAGTTRQEILDWFDHEYDRGLAGLEKLGA